MAMKTRTLLMLSVGVGLMILLAGGVLLLQLANGLPRSNQPWSAKPFASATST